jgi:hypothetical protein
MKPGSLLELAPVAATHAPRRRGAPPLPPQNCTNALLPPAPAPPRPAPPLPARLHARSHACVQDPKQSQFLVRDAVLAHLEFGGIRLEDNVVITPDGAESLTDVPRTVEDVEAVMAGAPWPRRQ